MAKRTDCSPLAATIAEIALSIGSRPEIKTMDDVVAVMTKDLPELDRSIIVNSIVEATTGRAQATDDLTKKLNDLKREARGDAVLTYKIGRLQSDLEAGVVTKGQKSNPRPVGDTVAGLRELAKDLRSEQRKLPSAVAERYSKQIDRLTEQLETNQFVPKIKQDTVPQSMELQRLAYERDKLSRRVRQKIRDLKPQTAVGKAYRALGISRALMTGYEMSFVGRQAGLHAFGTIGETIAKPFNPKRLVQDTVALKKSIQALASDRMAHKFDTEFEARANRPLYRAWGVRIIPSDHAITGAEEIRVSSWVDKVPGVERFNRSARVFLNEIRGNTVDALAETIARNSDPTLAEGKKIGSFTNTLTGTSNLGAAEKAVGLLNETFFSARYLASRFRFISFESLVGGSGATRKAVAGEYAKIFVGMAAVYGVAALSGAQIGWNVRSSNFGKIKVGNTWIDIMGGLSQIATYAGRMVTGEKKGMDSEKVTAISGKKRPYGGASRFDVTVSFLRSKLAPIPGIAADYLADQKDMVGQPIDTASYAAQKVSPLTYWDIAKAMMHEGTPRSEAMSIAAWFGAGLQESKH